MNRRIDVAHHGRLAACLIRLTTKYRPDILLLAECAINPEILAEKLSSAETGAFHYIPGKCAKIILFVRFPEEYIQLGTEGARFTMRHVQRPNGEMLLLAAAHLPPKSSWNDGSQATEAYWLSQDILDEEKKLQCQQTLLVGDLNMNPFETGMISAGGLHAVMTRQTALHRERIVLGRHCPFFYNPMWSLLGERREATSNEDMEPAGTYYDWRAEPECYFWNMFDQVLLRPALLPYFRNEELEIITTDGEFRLIGNNGLPDAAQASDHLPITFKPHI